MNCQKDKDEKIKYLINNPQKYFEVQDLGDKILDQSMMIALADKFVKNFQT